MEDYKISVIVPVYNVFAYLSKCIDSIIHQSYSNLEIILVDDGSTDGSGEMCNAYGQKDERVQVVHQKNQGLSSARNTALNIMTGDLVGFVDSDDWIEPDYYETLVEHMSRTGADIVVSGCYYEYQDTTKKRKIYPQETPCDRHEGLKALSEHRIEHTVWDKLYRKELFSSLRFAEGRVHEDVLITYRLILCAEHIECTDYYGYHQRMRAGSIAHCPVNRVENFCAHHKLWQDIKEQSELGKVSKEVAENFFAETVDFAYQTLYYYFIPCRKSRPELFSQAKDFWRENRRKISSLDRKFWLATYVPFPFMFKGWIRDTLKKRPALWGALKRTRESFGHNDDRNLLFE